MTPPTVWRRFIAQDEEFSILMPGEPTLFFTSITTAPGRSTNERIYSSYANGSVYLVVSYDASSLAGTLENYKAHHLYRDNEVTQKAVRVGAHEGREYQLKFGDTTEIVRIFSTKKHGYALATIQTREDRGLSEFFLSSLIFTDDGSNPAGNSNVTTPPTDREFFDQPQVDTSQKLLTGKEVTQKARVVSKPEPWYTKEARQSGVTGTVILRVVLSGSGEVTNIHVVDGLPKGLTEQAIEAAKHLKFMPAILNGKFVSCWVELQYNFNLY